MTNRLGVRHEDKSVWERRVAIPPAVARALVQEGHDVIVENSQRRVFRDAEYHQVGAHLVEQLDNVDVVVGVKEIPIAKILPERAHLFFSHTIKAQPYNMAMLGHILDVGATLFDHELIADARGRRLVAFGRFAGRAGAFETLVAWGQRLQLSGATSPLADLQQPHEYGDWPSAIEHAAVIAEAIRSGGLGIGRGARLALLGNGRVARGVRDVLDAMQVRWVDPTDLANTNERGLCAAIFEEKDMVVRRDGGPFDLQDFYDRPERYRSIVAECVLPHVDVLFNAIFWAPQYPVYVPNSALHDAERLAVIGDITCDIGGSVEATQRATNPAEPTYTWLPSEDRAIEGTHPRGVTIMAVDILPCEFPREASATFGQALSPFLPALAQARLGATELDAAGLPDELARATIVWRGKLTERWQHLEEPARAALAATSP